MALSKLKVHMERPAIGKGIIVVTEEDHVRCLSFETRKKKPAYQARSDH